MTADREDVAKKETLLIELGVEELPVSFLHGALAALPALVSSALEKVRLACGDVRALGTPRRLAVLVSDVPIRQSDRDEVVVGPPAAVAFDADGKPKPAAAGFAKKFGASAEQVRMVETPKGSYASLRVQEPGRGTGELLPELVPEVLRGIPFPKVMRWGDEETAFGRPVQWLLVLLGATPIQTSFAGIKSTTHSTGHRFLAPGSIAVPHAEGYMDAMREARVLVDPQVRAAETLNALQQSARECGGQLVPDAFLLKECASLVEWPVSVPGAFDEKYLELPEEVVVSVMRDHQRYFALRADNGSLLPRYLNVVNTAEAPSSIQRGNDRVLRARLEDASFFFREDRKTPITTRGAELDRVTFHRKLGTIGDKVRRMETVAEGLVSDARKAAVRQAAGLSKTDLVTLMVGEFPELQGNVGSRYAREEGVAKDVSDAVADHYLPKGADDDPAVGLPRGPLGAAVAIADRVDTLVGIFGIGLEPTGSTDPFALRRAAIGVLRIALFASVEREVRLRSLLATAYDAYPAGALGERAGVLKSVQEFVLGRIPSLLGNAHALDTMSACQHAWDGESLLDLHARIRALTQFRTRPAFLRLVLSYRRAHNITEGTDASSSLHGAGDGADALDGVNPELMEGPAERALHERFRDARKRIRDAREKRDYSLAFELVVKELGDPIDAFFDEAFVMAEDMAVRRNRLLLLSAIRNEIGALARLELLQVEESVAPDVGGVAQAKRS